MDLEFNIGAYIHDFPVHNNYYKYIWKMYNSEEKPSMEPRQKI